MNTDKLQKNRLLFYKKWLKFSLNDNRLGLKDTGCPLKKDFPKHFFLISFVDIIHILRQSS